MFIASTDNVVVVLGNREPDKGVTYKMLSNLENRFLHSQSEGTLKIGNNGQNNNVNADVIGYSIEPTSRIHLTDPRVPSRSSNTQEVDLVSELIRDNDPVGDDLLEMVVPAVGEGMAVKFMTHKKFAQIYPNL